MGISNLALAPSRAVPFLTSALLFSTPIGRPSFRHQPFVGLARVWFHTIRREDAVIGFSAPLIADPIRVSAAVDSFAAWQRPCTLQVDNTHADRLDSASGGRGPGCTCRTPTFIRMSPRKASSALSTTLLQSTEGRLRRSVLHLANGSRNQAENRTLRKLGGQAKWD
jgi:hypothetical protein